MSRDKDDTAAVQDGLVPYIPVDEVSEQRVVK